MLWPNFITKSYFREGCNKSGYKCMTTAWIDNKIGTLVPITAKRAIWEDGVRLPQSIDVAN